MSIKVIPTRIMKVKDLCEKLLAECPECECEIDFLYRHESGEKLTPILSIFIEHVVGDKLTKGFHE